LTNVSEVLAASIIALMMEGASTSETLVNFYQTTQHYKPEDSHLQGINWFEINLYLSWIQQFTITEARFIWRSQHNGGS
jgi:outer membrane biogenesis lipoprotein LolB